MGNTATALDSKDDRRSPYRKFYQINREHTQEKLWLATKHPKANAVLEFLLDQMDEYNAVICSYQVLEEVLEVSKPTVARAISVLKDNGFVHILKSGTSNVYVVNDDLAWSSWGNNRRYCKFPSNVILSLSENEEYQKQMKAIKHKKVEVKK